MSVNKYEKHQRSGKPKYVVSAPDGERLFSAGNEQDFLVARKEFMSSKKSKGLVTDKDD